MTPPAQKILVVDNHPLVIRFLTDFLRKHGHEVVAAHDALTALGLLKTFRPDIIFIDLVMPRIGGEQLCRIIRSRPEFRHTFIVILSAIAAEEQTDLAALGADACIAKGPFDRMEEHILALLQQTESGGAGKSGRILGLEDIYERQITRELLASRERLENILTHLSEGIIETTSDCLIIFTNPAAQALFARSEEQLLASDFCSLFAREEQQLIEALLIQITEQGLTRTLSPVPFRDKLLEMTLAPLTSEDERSMLIIIRDISQALFLERQLHEASITDELTGLLNRRGFLTLAEKQLQIAERRGNRLHLLFADFDDLKGINDTLGHQMGDQALRETAALLRNTFRESDIIGRIGGDEFAVLLTCFSGEDDQGAVLERLEQNRILQDGKGRDYPLSLSCGLVEFEPTEPCSLKELISRADRQMYGRKRRKKTRNHKPQAGNS